MKFQVFLAGLVVSFASLIPVSLRADGIGIAVIKADGSTHSVEISDIRKIDIASDALTIHHMAGNKTGHSYADVERIDIGVKLSGIDGIVADGSIAVWPTLVKESINVSGAPAGTPVAVYDLDGAVVASAKVTDATLSLDLSTLSAGAYIVVVGKQSVKILKH